jgi:uncharacterized RDD family membrane protein YckC
MTDGPAPPPEWSGEPGDVPGDAYGAYPPPPAPGAGFPGFAPWWRRLLAGLLDWLLVAVPVGLLGAVFGLVEVVRDVEGNLVRFSASTSLSVLVFLAALAYSMVMDGSQRGQTIGKMALLIQVRDATTGGPIGFARALGRRFIFLILFQLLFLPGLLNALSPLWDGRRQAWHDKAVNSVVLNAAQG